MRKNRNTDSFKQHLHVQEGKERNMKDKIDERSAKSEEPLI